jgi:gliding motility-associated-like protein
MREKLQREFLLFILLLVGTSQHSYAQLSSCVNADFELGNFGNWSATTGMCCPINSTTPGIINGRHTIMTGTGTDPNTNGAISVVAPGGLFSARLGNDNTGSQAEQLSYQINVDSTNALFIYRYAVVLEDPSHTAQQQPRFEIRVYDSNGIAVGCGTYNVYASAGIPGFVSLVNQFGNFVRYQDWTTVGLDLSPYIGQTVTIEFSTGDCKLGGHYGYAYVDCYCSPFKILNDFCIGSTSTTLTAPIGFASYLWSTGDTSQTIVIPNATVGNQYQCTMTSVTGCTITLTSVLTTTVIASAYGQSATCQNPVQFHDSSIVVSGSPINQWFWDFGDGTTSTLQNPLHSYNSIGNFTVSLLVTNGGGCTDTIIQSISIGPQPVAGFNASAVCPGTPTNFTDLSTSGGGGIVDWEWSFGDGLSLDSIASPSHVYQQPGTYPVQLIITDSIGCTDTLLQSIATLPGPVAGFTHPIICAENQFTFQDTTQAIGTMANSWIWNFGDGSPLVSGTPAPDYTYLLSGNYIASLVVQTTNGCTDTATVPLTVHPLPQVAILADTVCFGDPSSFHNQSSISSGSIVAWNWNFGDLTFSSLFEPLHTYSQVTTYPVMLRATSNKGCVDSAATTAHIWHLPLADFSVNDSAGCKPHAVQFTDQSTSADGSIAKWFWDFGNGDKDSLPVVEAKYLDAGSYDVRLTVTTDLGCVNDSLRKSFVTAYELPVSSFSFTPYEPSVFVPKVSFFDKSFNAIQWWWNFGDATTDVVQFPEHIYTQVGTYTVELMVESPDGCRDTSWQLLEVDDNYAFWIPNSFTPNNDGTNDVFMVKGFGYSGFSMIIFNRFGERIYVTSDDSTGWDGRIDGEDAALGVYVYQVEMQDVFGNPHTYNGHVTLVR